MGHFWKCQILIFLAFSIFFPPRLTNLLTGKLLLLYNTQYLFYVIKVHKQYT